MRNEHRILAVLLGLMLIVLALFLLLPKENVSFGGKTPEEAYRAFQDSLSAKKWSNLYDSLASSDRVEMETDHEKLSDNERTNFSKFLGIDRGTMDSMSAREVSVKFIEKALTFSPNEFDKSVAAEIAKQKIYDDVCRLETKGSKGKGLVFCVKENGRWHVSIFMKSRWSRNMRLAIQALRNLAMAQVDFKENDRDQDGQKNYWVADIRGLYSLQDKNRGSLRLISKEIAQADKRPSGLSPEVGVVSAKDGYWFVSLEKYDSKGTLFDFQDASGHNTNRFAFVAYPDRYNVSGTDTYLINQRGTWKKDTGGKVPKASPFDFFADGWLSVD